MKYFAIVGLVFCLMGHSHAGDAAKGKKLYKKIGCTTCHKKDGMGKAKMKKGKLKISGARGPRIAGLSEEYITAQMIAIQGKGKGNIRKTKYTSSMKAKIKKYSKKDFEDIAAYVSKVMNPSAGTYKGMLEK